MSFGTKYISREAQIRRSFPRSHNFPSISGSDIIAMGVVFALAGCQGPMIPFRGGRVDAYEAGPTGVPQPQDSLESHTEAFRRQGFTPTEMISLVACGHTLG